MLPVVGCVCCWPPIAQLPDNQMNKSPCAAMSEARRPLRRPKRPMTKSGVGVLFAGAIETTCRMISSDRHVSRRNFKVIRWFSRNHSCDDEYSRFVRRFPEPGRYDRKARPTLLRNTCRCCTITTLSCTLGKT
ncbi:hypothetical protein BR93DRAFT_651559 [Coniochaeta sp. PMI_546]|nr:hypothetical protein BR93DRAFT_651559 [Coniochaeta sp. PMI_546]